MAVSVSATTLVNSLLCAVQSACWRGRIAGVPLRDDPVFVIGHWRSGTTLLHELLALDPRHGCADTYACLAPSHFLLSRHLVTWWLQWLMPKRRPMDNVQVGFHQPQEDEWALCLLGLPSVYRTVAFPRQLPQCPDTLDLHDLPGSQQQRWDEVLLKFLRSISLKDPSLRLVLKSPPHTARVAHLHNLFPRARFVHVVRDPLTIYPSTLRLWTRLADDHGLQRPIAEDLEEFVLDTFVRMYDAFDAQRQSLPPGHLCEVRYEQLIADPAGELRRVYDMLELDRFELVQPRLAERSSLMAGYQVNRYQLNDQQRERVLQRWSGYCRRYGYAEQHNADHQPLPTQRKAG